MSALFHSGDDAVHLLFTFLGGTGLRHDPEHRLRAALPQQHPAGIAQLGGARVHGGLHGGVRQREILIVHPDVFQHLRIHGNAGGQHAQGQLGVDHHLHEHEGGDETVAGVGVLPENDMAGLLATDQRW